MTIRRLTWSFLLAAAFMHGATAAPPAAVIELPGTGIQLSPPPGTRLAPAGAVLVDATGQTIVSFMTGDSSRSLDRDPTWQAIFAHAPKTVTVAGTRSRLYRRTRAADGGAWDGWMLIVPRGAQTLAVLMMYTGSQPAAFERLPEAFGTLSWQAGLPDPELALGARLAPPGLRLVGGSIGDLTYNDTGKPGPSEPSLAIQPMPLPPGKADALFPAFCQPFLARALAGKPFAGPEFGKGGQHAYCEAWSKGPEATMRYFALIRLSTGAMLMAVGRSPASRFPASLAAFRAGVRGLKVLPGHGLAPAP